MLLQIGTTIITPFVIPEGVKTIGHYAFIYWYEFNQSMKLPQTLIDIGEGAFMKWQSFNQPFSIPNSVTTIEGYAFSKWKRFNQPNSSRIHITENEWLRIDNWVFCNCWSGTIEELKDRIHHPHYKSEKRLKALEFITKGLV